MTTVARVTILIISLFLTPLSGAVFAQPTDTATTSSTTTVSSESIVPERWYKSERISGDIDVGDFVVGPGRTEIQLNPGDTVIQEISVTNRISGERTFRLEVEDIVGSRDGSSPANLLGSNKGPHSIKDYISFPNDTFTLQLGERARIPVTISVPADIEPGGLYGSVLVSTVQQSNSDSLAAPSAPIIARIGSLFFVTVGGDVDRQGQTLSVSTINDGRWWYEKGPIDVGILYENTGSVHVNPYGEVSITNMLGDEVGYLELEPWFVLPSSLRVREFTWDREFLLGRYTITAKINRGYDDIVDEVSTSFWVLPWKIVGGIFLIVFIVIFSLRAFFRTFEFKRKT